MELSDGPLSDAQLMAGYQAGDAEAFGELFRRHRDRMWAVALRTSGNPEDAADALQDAMVSAFRRADSFRGDSAVSTWLHRIVVNACLDRMRRAKVRAAQPLPDDLEESAARGQLLAAPTTDSPESQAEQSDVRRRLLHALDQLSAEQKAALVLVDIQGMSIDKAADVLECAPGTVKSRCSRGRHRLAELLGGSRAAFEGDSPHGTSPASRASKSVPSAPTHARGGDQS